MSNNFRTLYSNNSRTLYSNNSRTLYSNNSLIILRHPFISQQLIIKIVIKMVLPELMSGTKKVIICCKIYLIFIIRLYKGKKYFLNATVFDPGTISWIDKDSWNRKDCLFFVTYAGFLSGGGFMRVKYIKVLELFLRQECNFSVL